MQVEYQATPEGHREELIRDLNGAYGLTLAEHLSRDQLESLLAEKLNILIRDDFHALVGLLYRIDINEERLKRLLQSDRDEGRGTDAGRLIARLIIERQLQKIESRRAHKDNDSGKDNAHENDCAEEKW